MTAAPYDREISELLIQAVSLAYQQYYREESKEKSGEKYDGDITQFPLFESVFSEYTQVKNFKSYNSDLKSMIDKSYDILQDMVYDVEKFCYPWMPDNPSEYKEEKYSSYLGFLLKSKKNNIIVFRGVRTPFEKKQSTIFPQVPCKLGGEYVGYIASGVSKMYMKNLYNKTSLQDQMSPLLKELDKDIPCYVTGHSFGGALAIITALELVETYDMSPDNVFMYNYGGSAIGDPIFAKYYDAKVPNSYRVVNTQDFAPNIPSMFGLLHIGPRYKYQHVGQEWSFRKEAYVYPENEPVLLPERNHLDMVAYNKGEPQVDPYYAAVVNEEENSTDE
ncbi:MAG: lipase family protein [Okeania sp. SIO3H1]|uniref:lipase family protein n=1 Tax=Okeania sp. SIO1I7 TaxID=2607772 RepID=UPI0013CC0D12|nr:lipase family protein [Okeania sp. SIO1I7]NEN90000.1 lipase family protein [Okeania sp. SIO3H1]NET29271.1 lipase family protein [Okeania sp. SIO1I7]